MKEIIDNLLKLQTFEFDKTATGDADRTAKLRAKIPAPILAHYDHLGLRGKKGVAAVRNSVCTGCHMSVPLGVTMALMHADGIHTCESCGRYLYLAEPAVTPKAVKREKVAAAVGKRRLEVQAA